MIKKVLAVILFVCIISTCFSVGAQNEVSVTIGFDSETVEVGARTALKITVNGNVKKVSARIDSNVTSIDFSADGLDFDSVNYGYTITFVPTSESHIIYCTVNSVGALQLTLKDIVCETDGESVKLDNVTANLNVIPKYTYIYTKDDLNNIRNDLNGAYLLMNDIEFSPEDFEEGGDFYNDGYGWKPIGAVVRDKECFNGEFNGNGYTISGLTINKAYYNYCGLFGVNHGKVTSLRVTDAYIDGRIGINMSVPSYTPDKDGDIDYEDKEVWTPPDDSITEESLNNYDRTGESTANLGIICGLNLGSITDCFVSGEIRGNNVAGGIAGRSNNKVTGCAAVVAIKDLSIAGGIVGVGGSYSNITDCVSEGTIEATLSGGILGTASGKVTRVYSLCSGNNLLACFGKSSNLTVNGAYAFGEQRTDGVSQIKPLSELSAFRFDGGNWTYGAKKHYPTALADLIKTAVPGDMNFDGKVDAVDLAQLKLYLAGLFETDSTSGDMDLDGNVNAVDLALLKLFLAGLY